jgi:hypothetical protein
MVMMKTIKLGVVGASGSGMPVAPTDDPPYGGDGEDWRTVLARGTNSAYVVDVAQGNTEASSFYLSVTEADSKTGNATTRQVPLDILTALKAGVPPAALYQTVQQLSEDVQALKSVGGRFLQSFPTKADLDAYTIPSTAQNNDYANVQADESQGGATTRYTLSDVSGTMQFVFNYRITDAIATTTVPGNILSSEADGFMFVELDGTTTLNGYDDLVTADANNATAIAANAEAIEEVKGNYLPLTGGTLTGAIQAPNNSDVYFRGVAFFARGIARSTRSVELINADIAASSLAQNIAYYVSTGNERLGYLQTTSTSTWKQLGPFTVSAATFDAGTYQRLAGAIYYITDDVGTITRIVQALDTSPTGAVEEIWRDIVTFTDSAFAPAVAGQFTLGTAELPWGDVYAANAYISQMRVTIPESGYKDVIYVDDPDALRVAAIRVTNNPDSNVILLGVNHPTESQPPAGIQITRTGEGITTSIAGIATTVAGTLTVNGFLTAPNAFKFRARVNSNALDTATSMKIADFTVNGTGDYTFTIDNSSVGNPGAPNTLMSGERSYTCSIDYTAKTVRYAFKDKDGNPADTNFIVSG